MTPELYGALASLGLGAIGVLGLFVRYVGLKLQAGIVAAKAAADEAQIAANASTVAVAENTAITRDIHKATNGRLAAAIDRVQVLTIERDNYRDMVNYVLSTPDGKRVLTEFAERRRVRVQDPALTSLLAMRTPDEERHS